MTAPIYFYKTDSLSNLKPNSLIALKLTGGLDFSLYVTDKTGIPYPLKDNTGGGGGGTIEAIVNTDGNLSITGTTTKIINVSSSLLLLINSALQSGDNVSSLANDANYITLADIPTFVASDYDLEDFTNVGVDPFAHISDLSGGATNLAYVPSPTQGTVTSDTGSDALIPLADVTNAGLLTPAEKVKLNNTSGVNSGNQTSIVGITGTKAQFNTSVTDGDILYVGDITQYTDELSQDSVGTILLDTTTIDFTYDDTTPSISAIVKPNSIDATHLVDNINISEFTNDSGYIADVNLAYTPSATNGVVVNDKGSDATITTVDFTNAGLLTPEEKQLLYNNASTGVTEFGGFSINVDTTKYDTGIVEGWFVDNTTNPNTPTKVFKSFPATTGNILTNLASQNVTYIAIDINGVHQQSGMPFEPEVQRDWIPLGVIVHSNRITINAVNNQPVVAISPNGQLSDLMESIGFFNIYGNVFSPNGINLNINKSAGHIFKQGSNFVNDNKDPHTLPLLALVAPTNIRYRTQLGTEYADTAVVDAGFYDLAGVRTVIPGTRWSIQRIYLFQSNLVRIQYGQATYTTKVEAIQAISTEAFVIEQNILENGLFRALLIVREGATDLTDTSRALFISAGKFGSVAGLGSLSTTSLQQAYNNSLTPEITTNSTLGAVTVKRGSALDTDKIFEGQNGAGTLTSSIDGNGKILGSTLKLSAITAPAYEDGLLFRDSANDFLTYYNSEADIAQQIGQEIYIPVRNNSGATIPNGSLVYVTGAVGQRPTIALAQANSLTTSKVAGLATHSIENNTDGYITSIGVVNDLNTSIFTAGDELYLSPSVAGGFTNVKPSGANFVAAIGTVLVANPSVGNIEVSLRPTADEAQKSIAQTVTGAYTFTQPITAPVGVISTDVVVKSQLDAKQDVLVSGTNIKTLDSDTLLGSGNLLPKTELAYALSDETSNLTVGTLITFRMPFAMTLSSVRISLNNAPTISSVIVDVKEGGVSIFSTLLSIDASEKTSTTAATPAVISDINLADDAEITVSTTQIGSGDTGKGLKILFKGRKA